MRVIIEPDYQKMSQWAAEHVIERINAFQPTKEKPFVLGLPTGSSPEGMYACLVKANKEGRVSFKNVLTFNMDEYVAICSTTSTAPRKTFISSTATPRTWLLSAHTMKR